MGERLLTPKEFGERLGVSRASAYRIIASGKVAVSSGAGTGQKRKRIRISESACDAYIRRTEQPART